MDSPQTRQMHLGEEDPGTIHSGSGRVRDLMLLRRQNLRPFSAANAESRQLPQSKGKNKGIPYRKEDLYDRVLQMKTEVNLMKTENTKLKTKMQQMEGKIGKKQGEEQPFLVDSLKQQLADMKTQFTSKDEELLFIKKRLKFTKLTEMETELKVSIDECTRLRRMLVEAMEELTKGVMPIDLQERFLKLKADYKGLKKEFFEMTAYVQDSKMKPTGGKSEQIKHKKPTNDLKAENAHLSKELKKIKEQMFAGAVCPNCGSELVSKSQSQPTSEKQVAFRPVPDILASIWAAIVSEDLKIPDLWQKIDPEMLGAVRPHQLLELLETMDQRLSQEEMDGLMEALGASQGESVHKMVLEEALERHWPGAGPDQGILVDHLILRMQSMRVESEDLPSLLKLDEPHCSLEQFIDHLETSLLHFKSELSQAIAHLLFTGYVSMPTDRVYSRLATLVGSIGLLTQETEATLDSELRSLFSGKYTEVLNKFQRLDTMGQGFVGFSTFLEVCKELEVDIPLHLLKYLKVLFYAERQELDQVPYDIFVQAFCIGKAEA